MPVAIALMRLTLDTADRAEMEKLVAVALASSAPGSAAHVRLRSLEQLMRSHADIHGLVRRLETASVPRPEGTVEAEYWAAEFDRTVAVSPEASVALYSLGDPDLLRQITSELVDRLVQWGALRRGSRVLDYGCGIGRVTAELAAQAGEVVGVDISAGMLREAGARLSGLANVRLVHAGDFRTAETGTRFDLILLVDVLPYLSDPMPLLTDLASWLAPGASLVVMNWSYALDLADQRALAGRLAAERGLVVVRDGTAEFTLWDGVVFHFLNPQK